MDYNLCLPRTLFWRIYTWSNTWRLNLALESISSKLVQFVWLETVCAWLRTLIYRWFRYSSSCSLCSWWNGRSPLPYIRGTIAWYVVLDIHPENLNTNVSYLSTPAVESWWSQPVAAMHNEGDVIFYCESKKLGRYCSCCVSSFSLDCDGMYLVTFMFV